jgi:type II restriction enzyme
LASLFKREFKKITWSSSKSVIPILPEIALILKGAAKNSEKNQKPFLLQPVWKTNGKSSELAENCLDVFTWSSSAFLHFITEIAEHENDGDSINRQTRTLVWLYLLLLGIFKRSKVNFESIVDQIAFNTKNDKAFAVSGLITNKIMRSPRLEKPVIKKAEIKNIILGGGQKLLSPERRFDAILALNSDIF